MAKKQKKVSIDDLKTYWKILKRNDPGNKVNEPKIKLALFEYDNFSLPLFVVSDDRFNPETKKGFINVGSFNVENVTEFGIFLVHGNKISLNNDTYLITPDDEDFQIGKTPLRPFACKVGSFEIPTVDISGKDDEEAIRILLGVTPHTQLIVLKWIRYMSNK